MLRTEFKFNEDTNRVIELILPFCEKDYTPKAGTIKGGYIEEVPLEVFDLLLNENFIDPEILVNEIPAPRKLFEFGRKAASSGYKVVFDGRFSTFTTKYDIYFDAIKVVAKEEIDHELINPFLWLASEADSRSVTTNELFAWWD